MNRALPLAALGLALLLGGAAIAQPTPDERCDTYYNEIVLPDTERYNLTSLPAFGQPQRPKSCADLADAVQIALARTTGLRERLGPAATLPAFRQLLSPRDVQPGMMQTGGTAGSAAQSESVPDARPVALAGGSFSAIGTQSAAGTVASIAFNPASFFTGLDPAKVAQASRFADVSLLVPVDGNGDEDEDGRIDYLGVRARINALGRREGTEALRRLENRFAQLLATSANTVASLTQAFEQAEDAETFQRCTDALFDPGAGTLTLNTACGVPVQLTSDALLKAFNQSVAEVRREVDDEYFGADLRLDIGDPTLSGNPGAWGVAGLVGIAGGKRFDGPTGGTEIRGRLGVYFAQRDSLVDAAGESVNRFAADGAIGVQIQRPYAFQHLTASLGLEGRFGPDPESAIDLDEVESDFLVVRGSVNVPLSASYSASLALALPLFGESAGPVISVGGNWQLLWPDSIPSP